MSLLEFEKQLFEEVFEEDSLAILSRGMGVEKLLLQLIKTYNDPGNLVLVIGTSSEEEDYIRHQLEGEGVSPEALPKQITSDYGVNERKKVYLDGGVLFVTSRILVVDLLVNRVSVDLITGLIVYKAHRILEACQEAFILRLFRMKNKTGFIKGLSQTAGAFTQGFGKLDRIMRTLFLRKLYLWPRFHAAINDSFESRAKPEVIEVRFTLSPLMKSIQLATMDLISIALKEMAKYNSSLVSDLEELNVENAISPHFGKMMRQKFDPIWHQLGHQTKRLIGDIRLLREVLFALTEDDCVTFHDIINSIRQSVRLDTQVSDWIFWDPAETLFVAAKQRLINGPDEEVDLDLEMNPKWNSFCEIINEIKEDTKARENAVNVLVMVREDRSIKRLRDVLDKGPEAVLMEMYHKSRLALPGGNLSDEEGAESGRKTRRKKPKFMSDENPGAAETLTQLVQRFEQIEDNEQKRRELSVHYLSLNDGYIRLEEFLKKYKPWFIIMYDPDMEAIRRLELYQAIICSPERCKIYFFMFDVSAEEQRYLTSLRREKEAFEYLIKEKATMVIPEERDGKCAHHPDLIRGSEEFTQISTRKAGGQSLTRDKVIQQLVIVDMREFRSELPSLIHKRGIDIEPVTIEIGDYILTPDTCVERKSVSDLICSLNNGRLYSQCSIMTRHYKKSILLIEFDQNKSFNLKGKYWGTGPKKPFSGPGSGDCDAVSKLILLTIHFPQLRCIWSPSPHFSAEVFEHLKAGKEQPDSGQAISISEQQLPTEHYMDKYDLQTKEFLLNLPGINLRNVYSIMNKFKCIADLLPLSADRLGQVLGNSQNGKVLHEALHCDLISCCGNDQMQLEKKTKASKRFKKTKTT